MAAASHPHLPTSLQPTCCLRCPAPQGPLFVGSGGGRGAAAAGKPKRPAILDPLEVRRMNEVAAKERERRAAEEKAAREAEAKARAEARAAERAAQRELK